MAKKPTKTLKSPKASRAIEKEFAKRLKTLTAAINNSVSYYAIANLAKNLDKNAPTQLRFRLNALLKQWDSKVSELAKKWAADFAKKIGGYVDLNLQNALKNSDLFTDINKALAVKKAKLRTAMSAIYERNLYLIKSIPHDIISRYEQGFMNSVENFDREALAKQARIFGGVSRRRAEFIARDQTSKATNDYHAARAQELGFDYYVWNTSQDERVSTGKGGHIHLNGRIYKYSEATAIIDSYGNKGHTGDRVNCLAEGQGVDFAHFPKRLFRLNCKFTPNFIKLTFGDFAFIVTSDHKMLTREGWVKASALNVGDYIIKEELQNTKLAEIDFNQYPFILSDFFCLFDKLSKTSLPLALGFCRIAVAGDFDENVRANENVDIIEFESLLNNGVEVFASECVKNFNFADPQMTIRMRAFISGFFAALSGFLSFDSNAINPTHSVVRFFSDLRSVFFGRICKADEISLAARADMIAQTFESVGYNISSHAECLSHFKNAVAASIELFQFFYINVYIKAWAIFSRFYQNALFKEPLQNGQTDAELATNILKKSTLCEARLDKIERVASDFPSHIFSLETELGYYSVNSLINKNCRCVCTSLILAPNQTLKRVKDGTRGDYYEIVEKE